MDDKKQAVMVLESMHIVTALYAAVLDTRCSPQQCVRSGYNIERSGLRAAI